jgi:hypothetical protein
VEVTSFNGVNEHLAVVYVGILNELAKALHARQGWPCRQYSSISGGETPAALLPSPSRLV